MQVRTLAVLGVFLALAMVPATSAHIMDIDATRISFSYGDNPSTASFQEPANRVNMLVHAHVQDGASRDVTVFVPEGFALQPAYGGNRDVTVEETIDAQNRTVTFTVTPTSDNGVLNALFAGPVAPGASVLARVGGTQILSASAVDGIAVLSGNQVLEGVNALDENGASVPGYIQYAIDTPAAESSVLLTFLPASAVPQTNVVVDSTGDNGWIWALAGLLLGAVIWAGLVQQGLVQARSRKQVVSQSDSETLKSSESKESLEARKGMLRAALVNLEQAKQAGTVAQDVYERLKAEYKKETVAVMRALQPDA